MNFFQSRLARSIVPTLGQRRCQDIVGKIQPHLNTSASIIDIGCGVGQIAHALKTFGHQLTTIDVVDICLYPDLKPRLYNGHRLPYAGRSFDVALLITVLHHTPEPLELILEARRIARQLIIMEDVYTNRLNHKLTCFMDVLLNPESATHPHTNKTDKTWREIFAAQNLKLTHHQIDTFWHLFSSATYVLDS
jgi:2-polyprenyl-3-methyl-5-hydroxy-6-metoxy-1,4-benzoquinol methylase